MILVEEFEGKAYRVMTPTIFRRIVDIYGDEYDIRITSGNSFLVDGNHSKRSFLVDVVGYSKGDSSSPVILESLD